MQSQPVRSLVLDHYGIYEDALSFCPWLEVAEWFDCRAPKMLEWLGVTERLLKLNSPLILPYFSHEIYSFSYPVSQFGN